MSPHVQHIIVYLVVALCVVHCVRHFWGIFAGKKKKGKSLCNSCSNRDQCLRKLQQAHNPEACREKSSKKKPRNSC